MSRSHISLDSETLSLDSNPLILAIGAVAFDPYGNDTPDSLRKHSFYVTVNVSGQKEYGRDIDPQTVMWWLSQSDAARMAIVERQKRAVYMPGAMASFAQWVEEVGGTHLWSHGAAEDAVWIRNACAVTSMRFPFHYRNIRDTRTVFDLLDTPEIVVPGLVDHYALDDAIYQALRVQEAYRRLKSLKSLETA